MLFQLKSHSNNKSKLTYLYQELVTKLDVGCFRDFDLNRSHLYYFFRLIMIYNSFAGNFNHGDKWKFNEIREHCIKSLFKPLKQ